MEALQIRKGGKLIKTEWVYDEVKEEGHYREVDITDQGVRHLFDGCTIADDVVLRDILLLLHNDIHIYDAILGNWTEELVKEGLTGTPKKYEYHPDNIEYLELVFTPEYSKNLEDEKDCLYGTSFPDFNGVGWELREDKIEEYGHSWKKGDRIPWGISLTPVNELVDIPVRLANKVKITESDYADKADRSDWWKVVATFDNPEYTLGQILYGIVWELSWHGGPSDRDTRMADLKSAVEDIKNEREN